MTEKKSPICVLVIWVFLLSANLAVRANDSAIEGIGGSLRPMQEHPSVRMVAEKVVIDLHPDLAEVDCQFTFHNEGPATTVRMGFPERNYSRAEKQGFLSFATWVDGKPVATTIEGYRFNEEEGFFRWRVKQVAFVAGQQRRVRVHYTMCPGRTTEAIRYFEYNLYTGAAWKGTIGKSTVIVNFSHLPWYQRITARPGGYRKERKALIWTWHDFEPASRYSPGNTKQPVYGIHVSFTEGYNSIRLNGEPVYAYAYQDKSRGLIPCPAELEGTVLWTPALFFERIIRGTVSQADDAKSATISYNKRTIRLESGKSRAIMHNRHIRLRHAPRLEHGQLYVPVNEVIRLLGGHARFDKKTGITYLSLSVRGKKQ
jgi:hypothetical protein